MKPSLRTAPNGSTDHLDRCAATTSVCPRMAMGRAEPLPLMRATKLARAGSSASSFTGMPSRSNTPARYLAASVSVPGGLEVSMRSSAVKCRNVSAFTLRQWTGLGAEAEATAAQRSRSSLQRNVAMFLARRGVHLVLQHAKRADHARASFARLDHIVDEAALGGDERVGEALAKLFGLLRAHGFAVGGRRELAAIDDVHRALRSHDGDFGAGPRQVDVRANVLGSHHAISAAVRLARDDGDLRHGGLGVGVEQLGAMADDPAEFLSGAREEAGNVLEGQNRNVERVAEAHETGALDRRIDIQAAGQVGGLIGDDAHGTPVQPREAHHDVAGKVLMDFEEFAVIDHAMDGILDVIGLVGFGRHQRVKRRVHAVRRVGGRAARRIVAIVLGQVAEQLADHAQALAVVRRDEMADAAYGVVRHGAAQALLGDVLVRDGLDDVRTGDEHVAGRLHHEDEIGDGRRVDGPAGAGSHDGGDLRDHATGQRVAQEDIGVAAQRQHAFLNARAAGIVEADDGRAVLHGVVHDLTDFLRVGFRERAAEDGEVLRENVDEAAGDVAVAGDEAVAGDNLFIHAEVAAAMCDELVELFEGAFVEEQFDALAGGELALFVLAVLAVFAAALLGRGVAAVELLELVHAFDCSRGGRRASRAGAGCWVLGGGLCGFVLNCSLGRIGVRDLFRTNEANKYCRINCFQKRRTQFAAGSVRNWAGVGVGWGLGREMAAAGTLAGCGGGGYRSGFGSGWCGDVHKISWWTGAERWSAGAKDLLNEL